MRRGRGDVRARLLVLAGFLGASLASGLPGLALLVLAVEGLLLAGGLARRQGPFLLAGLAALPLALVNAALVGSEPIAALGPLVLRREGLEAGLAFAARVAIAVGAGLWLVATVSARDALRLLGRWPRAALVLAGSLRFAPLVARDWARIREAQAMRGHAPGKGLRAAAHSAPLLVPLLVGAVRRGRLIQDAVEAGAFGSGPRTRRHLPAMAMREAALASLGLALLGLAAWRAAQGGGLP